MTAAELPALVATFGPVGGAAIWMWLMSRGKDKPADPAKALTEELRGLRQDIADVKDDVVAVRERLVRVETKLEAKPTRAR